MRACWHCRARHAPRTPHPAQGQRLANKLVMEPSSQHIPGEPTKRDRQKREDSFVHACMSSPEALGRVSPLSAPGSPSPGPHGGALSVPWPGAPSLDVTTTGSPISMWSQDVPSLCASAAPRLQLSPQHRVSGTGFPFHAGSCSPVGAVPSPARNNRPPPPDQAAVPHVCYIL